ncbi:MAG: S16 family serine protease [Candidatus Aenigmatarchaeota archaeon]
MIKSKKILKSKHLKISLIISICILIIIISFSSFYILENKNKEKNFINEVWENKILPASSNFSITEILVPSVTGEGKGMIARIIVEPRIGSGKIMVDIENIIFWSDTQYSIRIAKKVAERYFNMSLDNVDLIYSIDANATIVEGSSAGAALAIATIAALENKTIRKDVTITGAINTDGAILQVGGILEKGIAAKEKGIKTMLVPKGQSKIIKYETERSCRRIATITYCEVKTKPIEVDISKELGINIVEVSHVVEALNYMIEK